MKNLTTEILKLTPLSSCKKFVTINVFASPLINAKHSHRVPLYKEKKECGTTMPEVLLAGLKLRLLADESMSSEDLAGNTDRQVHQYLRHLLTSIHYAIEDYEGDEKISASKTFQNKVFRHIVWKEPLVLDGEKDLIFDNKVNLAHTVTMTRTPTFTIPSYLCKWILEKDGLNPDTKFNHVNPFLKRMAYEVFEPLHHIPAPKWQKMASFSRRIQNRILFTAFKNSMSSENLNLPLLNPRYL
jgi:hypothetical protein